MNEISLHIRISVNLGKSHVLYKTTCTYFEIIWQCHHCVPATGCSSLFRNHVRVLPLQLSVGRSVEASRGSLSHKNNWRMSEEVLSFPQQTLSVSYYIGRRDGECKNFSLSPSWKEPSLFWGKRHIWPKNVPLWLSVASKYRWSEISIPLFTAKIH